MKEKYQNILKIFRIWYAVNFAGSFLFSGGIGMFINPKNILSTLAYLILEPIVTPILFCIIFSPALICLYFLFKRFSNIKIRMFLVAFFIPFNNFIYLFIEHMFFSQNTGDLISMIIGAYTLFMLLPLVLITTFFIPKTLLPFKKEAIITNFLTGICGWILIILSGIIIRFVSDAADKMALKQYEPVITYLEESKKREGIYPGNFDDKFKNLKPFHYETRDNNKEYVINVDLRTSKYYYCSNKQYEDCKTGYRGGFYYSTFGKWTRGVLDD